MPESIGIKEYLDTTFSRVESAMAVDRAANREGVARIEAAVATAVAEMRTNSEKHERKLEQLDQKHTEDIRAIQTELATMKGAIATWKWLAGASGAIGVAVTWLLKQAGLI